MGILLLVVGGLWTLLGASNFVTVLIRAVDQPPGPDASFSVGFSLVFNGVIFVLPGLVLAAIGVALRRRAKTSPRHA